MVYAKDLGQAYGMLTQKFSYAKDFNKFTRNVLRKLAKMKNLCVKWSKENKYRSKMKLKTDLTTDQIQTL